MNTPFPLLSSPLTLPAGLTLKNRMLAAPTSLALLDMEEHYSAENIAYYKLKAEGGCSVVTVGDLIVELETGRAHPMQVGINEPGIITSLTKMAEAIHAGGAAASLEIDHGGQLCRSQFLGGKNALGPIQLDNLEGHPVDAMTEDDIYRIAEAFGRGALVAKNCGFDMVMIHAGHGWLLHQFISPYTNKRADQWGGSLENRMRFMLLVVEKVRAAVGRNFPIDIRISASERFEGGYGIETGIEIAKALDGKVDLLHVSAGSNLYGYSATLMHPGIFQKHGENRNLAAEVKKHVKTPVCTVGGYTQPEFMEETLKSGDADCIAMARCLIADPFLPRKVMRGRAKEIRPCLRCTECESGLMKNQIMRCSVNPAIGFEEAYLHPAAQKVSGKRVFIVGGGPAGMHAALTAQEQGHQVTLCDAAPQLGGLMSHADEMDFKEDMRLYRDSQVRKAGEADIDLRLNCKVDADYIRQEDAAKKIDALIVAVGSEPVRLPVPGADGKNVLLGTELKHDAKVADSVVVIGGGLIGCEAAVDLGRKGAQVTLIEMLGDVALECGRMYRFNLMQQIKDAHINVQTGMRCTRITEEGVYAADANNNEQFFPGKTVIMAAGMKAKKALADSLLNIVPDTYIVGDARRARTIMAAVRDAEDAVVNIGMY